MLLNELKTKDYDKFLLCKFAPIPLQEACAAIFTFHSDIAEIPTSVSEPMVGKIKIQWWRDVITEIIEQKPRRPHPILLALKEQKINYAHLLQILDCYEDVLDNKLPQRFEELVEFIKKTEILCLKIVASILNLPIDDNLSLAYSYNYFGRKLLKKNNILANKLFLESTKLLPINKKSLIGKITRFYNKTPQKSTFWLVAALLAGNYKLM